MHSHRLTAEELIGRAEELVPVLAERAPKTEELRRVPDETVRDLTDAGLLRVANPERYGGYGLDVDTVFEIAWRLAQGCGATGWFYSVTQSHNWQLGQAPEEAQEEYFTSPDVISSSAFAPTGKAERVEGGWQISGRWPFSSGIDHAQWVLLGALDMEAGGLIYLMVPSTDITILDDWHVSGLKGTGSKSAVITDPLFVPERRGVAALGPAKTEWRDRHGRASYGVPMGSIMPFHLVVPIVGMAQGAVTEFGILTKGRVFQRGPFRKSAAESAGPQFRIAESAAEADAALAILRADISELLSRGARGESVSDLDRARYRRDQGYLAKLSVSAVNRLFDAAGATALKDPSPLARVHRDANAGSHQIALQWDDGAELYGRVRLGVESPSAMW